MAWYDVVLKDTAGFDIAIDAVDGLPAAKARALYFLTDEYAQRLGTSHATLETHKVEVCKPDGGECVFDAFRQTAA